MSITTVALFLFQFRFVSCAFRSWSRAHSGTDIRNIQFVPLTFLSSLNLSILPILSLCSLKSGGAEKGSLPATD